MVFVHPLAVFPVVHGKIADPILACIHHKKPTPFLLLFLPGRPAGRPAHGAEAFVFFLFALPCPHNSPLHRTFPPGPKAPQGLCRKKENPSQSILALRRVQHNVSLAVPLKLRTHRSATSSKSNNFYALTRHSRVALHTGRLQASSSEGRGKSFFIPIHTSHRLSEMFFRPNHSSSRLFCYEILRLTLARLRRHCQGVL